MGYSMLLRTTLGMPERTDEGLPDDSSKNYLVCSRPADEIMVVIS